MKKIIAFILALVLCLAACAFAESAPQREVAQEFEFHLAEGDELYVENTIFNQSVTVSGDNAQIIFANCIFNGDIINTADTFTRVMLAEDNILNGRCIILNGNTEGHLIETALPKFITFMPADVLCEGCYGAVIAMGDFAVTFNSEKYTVDDAGIYLDVGNPDAGFVPYKGQPTSCFAVIQWWELGTRLLLVEAEYDPTA